MEDFSDLVPEEKHRFLICCIMGLAQPEGSFQFPNPLYHLGYEVAILEWDTVLNSKGEIVSPDLVLVSNKNNPTGMKWVHKSGRTFQRIFRDYWCCFKK
jgi:hypothetical protein